MSEESEDKTKRRYLRALQSYQWSYQHSVFYDDPASSHQLLEHMGKFKQSLRRACPTQPFLIRIQTMKVGAIIQAYLVIMTTSRVKKLEAIANQSFPVKINEMGRKLSIEKLIQITSAIERQKPHDLSKVFAKEGVNRWTILNKKLLIPASQTIE